MINDNYLEGLAKLMTGEAYTIPSHLAFGSTTGTLSATDLITSGEFDRNALSNLERSDNVARFIGSRSSAEANNEVIRVVGFHNSASLASSGNLQANFLVSSLIHTTDFDVEVELWVRHIRG